MENTFRRKTAAVQMVPGQGQQHGVTEASTGMFAHFDDHPVSRQVLNTAKVVLGYDLRHITHEQLQENSYMQPANVVATIAASKLTETAAVRKPDIITGHSLGALTAINAAGGITDAEAIWLAAERAHATSHAIRELGRRGIEGAMAAVMNIDRDKVIALCQEIGHSIDEYVSDANINGLTQIVISGRDSSVEKFKIAVANIRGLNGKRVVFRPLKIRGAYHSKYMDLATVPYQLALDAVDFMETNPRVKILSTTTTKELETPSDQKEDLANQLTASVDFVGTQDTIAEMVERSGIEHLVLYETGPYAKAATSTTEFGVLTDLNRRRFGEITLENRFGRIVEVHYCRVSSPEDIQPGSHAYEVLKML